MLVIQAILVTSGPQWRRNSYRSSDPHRWQTVIIFSSFSGKRIVFWSSSRNLLFWLPVHIQVFPHHQKYIEEGWGMDVFMEDFTFPKGNDEGAVGFREKHIRCGREENVYFCSAIFQYVASCGIHYLACLTPCWLLDNIGWK